MTQSIDRQPHVTGTQQHASSTQGPEPTPRHAWPPTLTQCSLATLAWQHCPPRLVNKPHQAARPGNQNHCPHQATPVQPQPGPHRHTKAPATHACAGAQSKPRRAVLRMALCSCTDPCQNWCGGGGGAAALANTAHTEGASPQQLTQHQPRAHAVDTRAQQSIMQRCVNTNHAATWLCSTAAHEQ
jgi:hypothetical protein